MAKNIKNQTVSALFWSFMDKGGQQVFQFAFTFILARLLEPKEFGLIAVLAIFIAAANILQESGFSSALIRKKNVDDADCASVFYFNIGISFVCYLVLFIIAPFIADFYDAPILTNLSRFLFLAFIFNAFGVIQNVHLIRKMDFRTSTQITLLSVLVSGLVAVYLAYNGFGVWGLAAQQVVYTFLRSLLLWIAVKWTPKASFSIDKLRSMVRYSSKLLLNSLFNQITTNMYAIVIGKCFSLTDSGFYSQANKLGMLPQSVVASALQSVAFPLLNNAGDDCDSKRKVFSKVVRLVSFICFPVALLTIVAAEPIVLIVLKDKWLGVVPILRYLAIGTSVLPLFYLLSSLLQSLGKSGLLLTIELIRNIVSLLIILVTIQYGVNGVVIGASCVFILSFFVGYHFAGKPIDYSLWQVMKDVLPYFLIAAISFLPLYVLSYVIDNKFLLLGSQALIGTVIYLVILKILGSKIIDELLLIVRKKGQ